MTDDRPRIAVEALGLDLPVYSQEHRSVRTSAKILLSAAFSPPKRKLRTTLDAISFTVNEGERLAIVGRNGAGKSTLLRVLVGAYPPSRGAVLVRGKVQALLNLSLGFNPEATLVENVMLRGVAMGMKPVQVAEMMDDVFDFSELGHKAGDRLKTLSSGQRMRLGFSLATARHNEILVMDEWIGTGDAQFVAKAKHRIRARVNSAQIVVLASHNLKLMREVCTKGLLLEEGKAVAYGDVPHVLDQYQKLIRN